MGSEAVKAPIYCRRCQASGEWVRAPERDIRTVKTNRLVEAGYRCPKCGQTTIVPVR